MAQYTGSGPGRFFRAWRYQRRRRLNVVNYVSVLLGFLTIVTTIFMAFAAMTSYFFQKTVIIYFPENEYEDFRGLAEDLYRNLNDLGFGYREGFYIRYYRYFSHKKLTGFTVRYFRDEPGIDETAKSLYENTKWALKNLLQETDTEDGAVLRGRLFKLALNAERGIRGVEWPKQGIIPGNFPHYQYEIWLGSDLVISESEASDLHSSTE